jgi:hypothetical protein
VGGRVLPVGVGIFNQLVIPAKAATQQHQVLEVQGHWVPAFAGMTSHGQI